MDERETELGGPARHPGDPEKGAPASFMIRSLRKLGVRS